MTADLTIINASNGSGEAVRSLVTVLRNSGATVITVDSVSNWPAKGIATTGTLDTNGRLTTATMQVFKYHLSGSTIVIDGFAPGYTDKGNAVGDVVVIKPATYWADTVADSINGLAAGTSIASSAVLNVNSITTQTLTVANASSNAGWYPLSPLPTITSIVANGNRSYTINTSTDETGTLSPGMRLRLTRTVAAPTQSTSLNGTTQFWNNTSPNKLTFTNNFVVSAWVKLSSYAQGTIASRYNGTSGWDFAINATGQIELTGFNGGSANFLDLISYQSIPLNKWVHVAAQMDMTVTTVSPTTNYFMIDGVDVPGTAARAGTSPTALIQAGNLEIGSRNAGTRPFPGKIAQVAIYNAKVAESAIAATISQGLQGTETNLASAWSFNGVATDLNTTTPNNLTAQGSALATAADSPFGGQAGGAISSTVDYAIIQKVTPTAITVQVPEGCTIPTTGGISAISYSGVKAPFGMPIQREKWHIDFINQVNLSIGLTANTWGNLAHSLNVPVGEWSLSYQGNFITAQGGTFSSLGVTLSTANNSNSDIRFRGSIGGYSQTVTQAEGALTRMAPISQASMAPWYLNLFSSSSSTAYYGGQDGTILITAENAHL